MKLVPVNRVATLAALWVLVFATAACAATAPAPSAAKPKGVSKGVATAIELVETVPVETKLGNPELRQARDVWIEMIDGAKSTIDLEQFYLSTWPSEPLEPVLKALGRAGARGVRVRLLLDAGMRRTYPMPADSLAKLAGFQVRAIDIRRITGGGVQHSKYFIVDGQDVFLGSQNFDWRALSHIHELGARIRDARVASSFGDVFEWDWAAADTTTWTETAGRKAPAKMTPHVVTAPIAIARAAGDTARVWPSYSPRGFIPDSTRWDLPAVLALINGARNEVVVQLLTYAPEEYGERDTTIDAALRAAAARGVKVKLLIADWIQNNKKGLGYLQRLSTVPNVEIKLSTIPEWTRAYIPFARVEHCKYAVADGAKVWVGTANWGPGYFNQTRNIAVTIDHTGIAAQARRIFETSWTATSAAAIRAGDYPEKVRGTTPPAGKTVYGN